MEIHFFQEDTEFELINPKPTQTWINKIIEQEGYKLQELNFIFCSDDYLHNMNLEYLDHDTFTDIITFDNSEDDKMIEGDIFISIDRIKDNANSMNIDFENELHRVIIHGVLHLLGYGDKTESEKSLMRLKENESLTLL
ncbi:rRNA maturation RNase YbeY [Fulvivirga sediminis]|uniref:Endoribonuclease YbeY n=1 Tax=Fulvivirga sediminis TaxID=2803949 RepID=A0A937F5L7_9BACT|nr:rRNA maturation RNase YbeY [Fulvivirga sediminis]MBL3654538.1 rRNA maturation RNase YbeY [Fulvivirga sediminis]